MSGKTVITFLPNQKRCVLLRIKWEQFPASSSSSRSRRVRHRQERFRANFNGNPQIVHRSNRYELRIKNMAAISSIKYYAERIEGNRFWYKNFNREYLTQSSAKLQTKSFYMIYNTYSIIFLTQFDERRWSKSNLSWWQLRCRCDFQLENAKQVRDIAARDAWNVRFSSTVLYPSGIFSCHGARTCFNGEEPSRIFHFFPSKTCKQRFNSQHNWWIRRELSPRSMEIVQLMQRVYWSFWAKLREKREFQFWIFCYDEKWLCHCD